VSADLTTTETTRLGELEETIERGLQTFLEVGLALTEIRESKLYRVDFDTFEAYCKGRWGFTRRRANQLVEAARVGTMVPVENERQARELAPLREVDEIRAVWRQAEHLADKSGDPMTAAVVKEAATIRKRKLAAEEKADRFAMKFSPRGSYCGRTKPLPPERVPAALAAHERARAASDEIRLVLGPWSADGRLPDHRRVPESPIVAAWRRTLNGNGAAPTPSLAKVIADLKKIRAAGSADADLDEAITALERAYRKQRETA
jgi:hypothetical protein